jgi:hypothetical protein
LWLEGLDADLQHSLLTRFREEKHIPTIKDWQNIFNEVEYEFEKSWHARGIKVALLLVLVLSLWGTVTTILRAPSLVSWENGGYALVVVGLLLSLWWLIHGRLDLNTI